MSRLRPLMMLFPPFDVLESERIQDELIAGGVRDLLLPWGQLFDERPSDKLETRVTNAFSEGRFCRDFYAAHQTGRMAAPPFAPTLDLYQGLGATPPRLAAMMQGKADRFARLIEQLSAKGVRVYFFGYIGAGVDGEAEWESDEARRAHAWDYVAARYRDYYIHFPKLSGFVVDGNIFGYEISPGFRFGGQLFAPVAEGPERQSIANRLNLDLGVLQRASDRIQGILRGLTPAKVDLFLDSQLGVFDAIDLLIEDDAILDLLRLEAAVTDHRLESHSRAVKAIDARLEFGTGPRLPCFGTMQGQILRRLARFSDFVQPKHYYWMEGFDGLKGTMARYASTLREWNTGLDESRIEALICRLLGVRLPPDYHIADFDRPAPKSFFDEIASRESKKMLFRIGDSDKISPYVALEHRGIWLSSEELRYLLQAMVDAGLTRFTYLILNTITDDVWKVITEFTAD